MAKARNDDPITGESWIRRMRHPNGATAAPELGRSELHLVALEPGASVASRAQSSSSSASSNRVRVVTQRSLLGLPGSFREPPGRVEEKYMVVPSRDRVGAASLAPATFTGDGSWTGVDQGSRVVARVDTQM